MTGFIETTKDITKTPEEEQLAVGECSNESYKTQSQIQQNAILQKKHMKQRKK